MSQLKFDKPPDAIYVVEYDLIHGASNKTYRLTQAYLREDNFIKCIDNIKKRNDERIVRVLVYKPEPYK
jgi:hypothetical protein